LEDKKKKPGLKGSTSEGGPKIKNRAVLKKPRARGVGINRGEGPRSRQRRGGRRELQSQLPSEGAVHALKWFLKAKTRGERTSNCDLIERGAPNKGPWPVFGGRLSSEKKNPS